MSFFEVEAPSIQVDANKTLKRLIKWSNGGKDKVMERPLHDFGKHEHLLRQDCFQRTFFKN